MLVLIPNLIVLLVIDFKEIKDELMQVLSVPYYKLTLLFLIFYQKKEVDN